MSCVARPPQHGARHRAASTLPPCRLGCRIGFSSRRCVPRRLTVSATRQSYGSFQEMVDSEPLMLVDFFATWCGPCLVLSNQLSALSTGALKDRIKIAKVDTEKYPALASQWGVQALPTLVLFKEGRMIDRIEGAPNAQQLLQWLQPHLPPSPNASGQEASPSAAA